MLAVKHQYCIIQFFNFAEIDKTAWSDARDSNPHWMDFLTTLYHYSRAIRVVVWTMSSPYLINLGGWYIVSTHLGIFSI